MANEHLRDVPLSPTLYLRKKGTGQIFAYAAGIAMRNDMEPYDGPIVVKQPKTTFEEGVAIARKTIEQANAEAEQEAVDTAKKIIEDAQKEAARIIAEANSANSAPPATDDGKMADIVEAIGQLPPENYTKAGLPDAQAITKILGVSVTKEERDEAWKIFQEGK
jgi:hypothetical protein